MSTIDEQFVEYVVKTIVGNPDDVKINRSVDEMGVLLELEVNTEDLGRVIGKRGSTAQSIRTLLRALGTKNDARYNLKIVDPENDGEKPKPAPAASSNDEDESQDSDDSSAQDDSSDVADEQPAQEEEVEEVEEPEEESLADKTRKELEDLDDLDI